MTLKTIKLVFGSVLLLASLGVLLSLTAFSDIHKLEKVNVEKNGAVSVYTDRKGKPISGVIMKEFPEEKGARINIPVKDGITSGMVKQFDGDAKKIAEFPYKDGLLDGIATFYDRNGVITGVSMYSGGLKNGKETVFDGEAPASEAFYENGTLLKFIKYAPGGEVEYERSLANGDELGELPPPLPLPDIP